MAIISFSVGDIVQMRVTSYAAPQVGFNILHWRVTTATGAPDDVLFRSIFTTAALSSAYRAILTTYAAYRGYDFQRISPTISANVVDTGSQGAGTTAVPTAPLAMAGIITKKTFIPGRRGRGRLYFPFFSASNIGNDGTPVFGWAAQLDSVAAILLAPQSATSGGNTIGIQPILWAKRTSTFTNVTSWLSREKFGTQHRRGDYGTPNIPPY